ncbi:hypothetical protein BGX38DRAFT_1179170 [Terfezia claveryi]|nr:hypothetical protein BGX38DRAFT_1179170 [Terfezia claveryi]
MRSIPSQLVVPYLLPAISSARGPTTSLTSLLPLSLPNQDSIFHQICNWPPTFSSRSTNSPFLASTPQPPFPIS